MLMQSNIHFSDQEVEIRRNEVARRMANTPMQPRVSRPFKLKKRKL